MFRTSLRESQDSHTNLITLPGLDQSEHSADHDSADNFADHVTVEHSAYIVPLSCNVPSLPANRC